MNNETKPVNTRRNKLIILFLAAFFALPYLVVFIYQANPELSIQTGMSNKGHLFSPVQPLEGVANERMSELKGNWTMIYISGSSCDQDCLNQHYTMRQVRLASGKRRYLLQRVNLIAGDSIDQAYTEALAEFPQEHKILLDNDDTILKKIDDLPLSEQLGRIYLMDPFLNIVLRYSAKTDPKDLLHDINKLILE